MDFVHADVPHFGDNDLNQTRVAEKRLNEGIYTLVTKVYVDDDVLDDSHFKHCGLYQRNSF